MGLADDVAYVGILFASIGFGKLFRLVPPEVENGIKSYRTRRYNLLFWSEQSVQTALKSLLRLA